VWQVAIHSEDLPELLERWRSILASGEPSEMEARLRRLDGEYRWFLFRICPLADASVQVVKWCGMNTDIVGRDVGHAAGEQGLRSGDRRQSKAPPLGAIVFAVRNLIPRFADQALSFLFRFQGDALAEQTPLG
jgi:PAS fold